VRWLRYFSFSGELNDYEGGHDDCAFPFFCLQRCIEFIPRILLSIPIFNYQPTSSASTTFVSLEEGECAGHEHFTSFSGYESSMLNG
jgi:hypothetical protein